MPTDATNEPRTDHPHPDEPPLQKHGDPLLAAASGEPVGEGTRHGYDARENTEQPAETPEE